MLMGRNVCVTGTGRPYALGFNLVLRYLEAGDRVVATVRKQSADLEKLKEQYGDQLIILTMDIGSTDSVNAAAEQLAGQIDHLDLLINNAVTVSPDFDKGFFDANLDYIAKAIDVAAVGPMGVLSAAKKQRRHLVDHQRVVGGRQHFKVLSNEHDRLWHVESGTEHGDDESCEHVQKRA